PACSRLAGFGCDRGKAPCRRTVWVPAKGPKEPHLGKSHLQQSLPQFLAGVDGVVELESLGPALAEQDPFVSNPGPIVEYLMALHQHRAIRQMLQGGGLEYPGKLFLPRDVQEEHT